MKIDDIDIPIQFKELFKSLGYHELYPPQEEAIKLGLLNGENLVVATPTASGKTFIAILAAIKHISEKLGKVVYLVPLRALAMEKYREFKVLNKVDRSIRINVATGDFDDPAERLGSADIIIATYEKMDSILRHKPKWINNISLIVIDEIHYLHSSDRGPTLEILITRLLREIKNAQIIGLSATIRNVNDFKRWLNTKIIHSTWRPVPLKEGVFVDYNIVFNDGEKIVIDKLYGEPKIDLALDTIRSNGQVLIFVSRRREAVSLAKKVANVISRVSMLSPIRNIDFNACRKISQEIIEVGEVTDLSRQLSEVTKWGVSFHHAGLSFEHREVVERKFRDGDLKVVIATPTLAAGINLPARRVIITYLYRYELGFREPITVFEYKQMAGRAGRPQYDEYGEAILLARNEEDMNYIMETYICGDIEPIDSKLSDSGYIDMHILGVISSKGRITSREIKEFFKYTLCSIQRGHQNVLSEVDRGLNFLLANDMVRRLEDDTFYVTAFGKRTAELYVLPLTAVIIREKLEELRLREANIYDMLHLIVSTPDSALAPLYSREREIIEKEISKILDIDDILSFSDSFMITPYKHLQVWKTILVLNDWINEVSEEEILRKWKVEPGDLQNIRSTAEWISYASGQIARLFGYFELYKKFNVLSKRLRYGVKDELMELVSIEGIGRVRARQLYNYGYKRLDDIRKARIEDLIKIPGIGEKLARKLLEI